jgi:hypothetical protein
VPTRTSALPGYLSSAGGGESAVADLGVEFFRLDFGVRFAAHSVPSQRVSYPAGPPCRDFFPQRVAKINQGIPCAAEIRPRGCLRIIWATPTRLSNLDVPGQPRRGRVPECRGRPLCLPIRIVPAVALRIIWAAPTRLRNLDVPGQPRRGSVPECRGRPLCLPIRIAPVAAFKKGRPLCLPIRIAPVAVFKKGRHRGLPLRATQHR